MNLYAIMFFIFNFIRTSFDQEIEQNHNDSNKKLNVVIFFTHVDSTNELQKNSLEFLNLHETTRLKHSLQTESSATPELPQEDARKGSMYCKELLKDSLMTLTHYCHTVLKMKTAIASVSSKEKTNDIQEPEAPFHESNVGFSSEVDSSPRAKRSQSIHENESMQQKSSDDSTLLNRNLKANSIITGTKHTEVFKIRVKRNASASNEHNDDQINIRNEAPKTRCNKKPSWDILDVMKHVRYSFLGKMFENPLHYEIKADQDDLADLANLGKEKLDAGLFTIVKSTLATLLESPERNFLMVIFGGHLRTIKDKHSPMVQSIKHVMESTNCGDTLIIVTGSCAEIAANKNQKCDEATEKPYTIPVYAKGPKSEILSECTLLYDIPLTVRKILELHGGTGNK